MQTKVIVCPACGNDNFDLCRYESMMVLREDTALFTLRCSRCATKVSLVHAIPLQLKEEVRCAAIKLGAGMGHEK